MNAPPRASGPHRLERVRKALKGRYVVEQEAGRGGSAVVYVALDVASGRRVAVKVLRPDLAAVVGAERFLQEIRVTSLLDHPLILPLLDSGEVDGLLYYVMPFVGGESLRDRLRREPRLPMDEAVAIAGAVATALAHAHERGVLHRDIKPENVLFRDGTPVITDFGAGLADVPEHARITEAGVSVGTPQYMSPEQAAGLRETDARTDIYSLGCVLCEMLTGKPPYTGATPESILVKIASEPAEGLGKQLASMPAPLAAVVKRAIAPVPAERFESVRQFADALVYASAQGAAKPLLQRQVLVAAVVALVVLMGAGYCAASRRGAQRARSAATRRTALYARTPSKGSYTMSGAL